MNEVIEINKKNIESRVNAIEKYAVDSITKVRVHDVNKAAKAFNIISDIVYSECKKLIEDTRKTALSIIEECERGCKCKK